MLKLPGEHGILVTIELHWIAAAGKSLKSPLRVIVSSKKFATNMGHWVSHNGQNGFFYKRFELKMLLLVTPERCWSMIRLLTCVTVETN